MENLEPTELCGISHRIAYLFILLKVNHKLLFQIQLCEKLSHVKEGWMFLIAIFMIQCELQEKYICPEGLLMVNGAHIHKQGLAAIADKNLLHSLHFREKSQPLVSAATMWRSS